MKSAFSVILSGLASANYSEKKGVPQNMRLTACPPRIRCDRISLSFEPLSWRSIKREAFFDFKFLRVRAASADVFSRLALIMILYFVKIDVIFLDVIVLKSRISKEK